MNTLLGQLLLHEHDDQARPLFMLTCILLLGTSIKPKAAPELDTLWMGQRLDHDLCWITWESSYLPVLDGIPNARHGTIPFLPLKPW